MRRAAVLLLFALVPGGASSAASLRAPSVPPRVGILAVGDFGVGGDVEIAVGTAMRRFERRHDAKLFVPLGDNDYTQSPARFRANWRAAFGWLRRSRVGVAGTLGNHDVDVGRGLYELYSLSMGGTYYTRQVGNVQLFLLDSNEVNTQQTQWLEAELARSTAEWRIAAFHHPAYGCGVHEGDEDVQRSWVPLFERYHVQLVLNGHDHNYQRFADQRGVTYVLHGGGGASSYRLGTCPAWYPPRVRARVGLGFLYLVAQPDRLDGYAVRLSGRAIDHFTLTP